MEILRGDLSGRPRDDGGGHLAKLFRSRGAECPHEVSDVESVGTACAGALLANERDLLLRDRRPRLEAGQLARSAMWDDDRRGPLSGFGRPKRIRHLCAETRYGRRSFLRREVFHTAFQSVYPAKDRIGGQEGQSLDGLCRIVSRQRRELSATNNVQARSSVGLPEWIDD